MLTETIVLSNAVALLGHAPITSLTGNDKLVLAAQQAYQMLLPSVLSKNDWRFAVNIAPLVQSAVIPPSPWKIVYNLPSGYLKLIRLYPNIYEWEIYNNSQLYSIINGNLQIEYVFQPEVSQLPGYFVNYFVYEIAYYLALSNAQKPEYAAALASERDKQFSMAAAIDAQNRPNFSQVLFPVLVNRSIGGFIGNGGDG